LRQPTGVQPPGLGLGLATARRAASLLGCKLSVHSAVGRGSRFILSVPSGQLHTRWNALDGANDDTPVRLATTPGDDRYMLMLEEDEAGAGAMGMLFDQWRHRSIVAPSYSRMLGAVLGTGIMPKMIIADLHLDEDVDGIDAVVRLRNDLKMDIPAALVTAEQSREIQER